MSSSTLTDAELHEFDPVNFEAPKLTYPCVEVLDRIFDADPRYIEIRVIFQPKYGDNFLINRGVFAARKPYILSEIKSIDPEQDGCWSGSKLVKDVIRKHTRDYLEALCR